MRIDFNIRNIISWIFGIVVFAIGIVNTFWGNDPEFGIFVMLISFAYFPPIADLFQKITGFKIPGLLLIILGIFVLWAALGVGELLDKIDLMMMSI